VWTWLEFGTINYKELFGVHLWWQNAKMVAVIWIEHYAGNLYCVC
jgi:hypothetical protein